MSKHMESSEEYINNAKKNSSYVNQFFNRTENDVRFAPPWKSHRRLSSLQKIVQEGMQNDFQNSESSILEITRILLRDTYTRHKYDNIEIKVIEIEISYRKTMASYLNKFKELIKSKEMIITLLQKSFRNFLSFSWITAEINLVSSLLDVGLMLLHPLFKSVPVSRHYKLLFYFSTFSACASMIGSLFAITYVRTTSEKISEMLREDKYMRLELESMFYRGNWIDEAVQKLFPYGVNLSLIRKAALEGDNEYANEKILRQHMCFVILLSNLKKDKQLLKDEEFLTKVKVFVESSAARIWWNRMKIRKLMEGTSSKTEDKVDKIVKSSTEVFVNQAAFSLYPIMFPLFFNSWMYEKTLRILRAIAAIVSIMNLEDEGTTVGKDASQTVKELQKQYEKVKSVYETIGYEYD